MTFEEAFHSYMIVSGTQRSAAYQDNLMCRFFISQFGRNCPILDITPRMISRALGTLRDKRIKRKGEMVPLSPATINRHTQFLQRVFTHAQEALGEDTQHIKWKAFLTIEPERSIYPLTPEEEKLVLRYIDPAVRPVFQFSLLTGVRLRNAIGLKWSMIDIKKEEMTFRGKSRRPGGKVYVIPLTNSVLQLLENERGNHDIFVFTFEAKANDRHGHHRGRRYPLTARVVRHYWDSLDLGKRWHDVRHTFGTRLYGISKDIHLVQRAMNHTDINTTMRYVHTNREDIKAAMEQLSVLDLDKVEKDMETGLFPGDPGWNKAFRNVNKRSAESHNLFSDQKQENIQKGNIIKMVPRRGLEPPRLSPLVPEKGD
jgi:integrase